MDSLVQDRIFRRVGLMDYQGICSDRDNPYSGGCLRNNPIQPVSWLFKYFFTFVTTWFSFFTMPVISWPTSYNYEGEEDIPIYEDDYEPHEYGQPEIDEHVTPETERVTPPPNPPRVVQATTGGPRVVPDPAHARPCDLKTDLYLLQPDRLNSSGQSNPLKVFYENYSRNFRLTYPTTYRANLRIATHRAARGRSVSKKFRTVI